MQRNRTYPNKNVNTYFIMYCMFEAIGPIDQVVRAQKLTVGVRHPNEVGRAVPHVLYESNMKRLRATGMLD